jgi:hypothetical protein
MSSLSSTNTIDITSRLSNAPTTIKIAEDVEFVVNDKKNNILQLNQLFSQGNMSDIDTLDKAIRLTLGEEAYDYIEAQNWSLHNYHIVFIAIMASVLRVSYEDAEKRFLQQV